MESIVGKILCDRYRIIRELSQDDFSTVFDAEDLATPNQLQCKIEKLQPSYDSEVLGKKSWQRVSQAFIHQGNIFQSISQHPQIPQLLAFFECDRHFYLVREFIKGQTLAQKLEHSSIEEGAAINWLQDILGILDFIHQAGITHLNIQPSSLIEQYDGKKFLTNFSSVRDTVLFDKSTAKNLPNTNYFVPPEQTEGITDFSTDIYALGKTIIYALNSNNINIFDFNLPENEQPLILDNIRTELADILKKMVDENPAKRYQSAAEVLNVLDFSKPVVTLPPPMFANFQQPIERVNSNRLKSIASRRNTIAGKSRSKQKMIWLLLALPFIVASIIILIGINKYTYDDFKTYANINYQFVIKYPQTWKKRDLDDPITGDVVVFSSPSNTDSDLFGEQVYLTVEYLVSKNTTVEQYTQNAVDRIEQVGGSNIKITQDRSIDRLPTTIITYDRPSESFLEKEIYSDRQSRSLGNTTIKQMEAFAIKDDRVYIAIYTAEEAQFYRSLDTINKMIRSWEIE